MTIYLIHLSQPFGTPQTPEARLSYGLTPQAHPNHPVRHYLGFTDDLAGRLAAHQHGNGSAMMAAVARAGIAWQLVRTWAGDRARERRMKSHHHLAHYCPICNPTGWASRERTGSCAIAFDGGA